MLKNKRRNISINNNKQIVCINIDDSGKLVKNENVTIYAGLVFLSKSEKDKFITQYRSIITKIKHNYCKNGFNENLELKHNNLKPTHNRQLMNYIKKYSVLCCIINNNKIYTNIKANKATRGRFLDFALKLLIKETFKNLIKNKLIDPNKPVKLILNIDEQTTKSNGYYNLADSIIEELKFGIQNFNYSAIYNPILNSDFEIKLQYQKSEKSYLIQASDLVAGTIRRTYLNNLNNISEFNKRTQFVNYKIFLP